MMQISAIVHELQGPKLFRHLKSADWSVGLPIYLLKIFKKT